ncbi:hypothetical protein PIROE2DRAFT_3760 [Piromyces sp. E2]|nr:hypothetical protein PIROE2DRAFT_3760 [Piromyces sp. E2]|eukprot:OUM68471.1 hypothetical protein PIROE2DRAFT_3760 [Piromyces sp. E2]
MENCSFSQDLKNFLSNYSYEEKIVKNSKFKFILSGKEGNPEIVFFNGLNMQEAWIKYVEALEKDYRLLLFQYPLEPKTNNELLDLIMEFFKVLNIKKSLIIGASDGGMLAQLYVRRFPDNLSGLVLMTTVTLDSSYVEDMNKEKIPSSLIQFILKFVPYSMLKKKLIGTAGSYIKEETESERNYGKDFLMTIASDKYYKKKFIHIFGIVDDMRKQNNFKPEEFKKISGKILLLHPEEDLFTVEDQNKLTDLMPDPEVHKMKGGHLAFIICADEYIKTIKNFFKKINY